MSAPEVSIVMCAYRRADLLRKTLESFERQTFKDYEVIVTEDGCDGGWTKGVCEDFGVRYFLRRNRPDAPYSNPSVPWNISIKQARGEVLILQNPECEHADADVIEKLAAPHREHRHLALFAAVQAMNQNGTPYLWYCHPRHSARPLFFCGSVRRENVLRVGGFDEDFKYYGYDDDWFAQCLSNDGIEFSWREDINVRHLWHPGTDCFGLQTNVEIYNQKMQNWMNGAPAVANVGREWGVL